MIPKSDYIDLAYVDVDEGKSQAISIKQIDRYHTKEEVTSFLDWFKKNRVKNGGTVSTAILPDGYGGVFVEDYLCWAAGHQKEGFWNSMSRLSWDRYSGLVYVYGRM